ncbi:hypothetical protein ADL21_15030 [Streptomyces albus subsp. albus]|nr:hypothetical protein ADL21_15030 [Streptomyces albus subsp. albus]
MGDEATLIPSVAPFGVCVTRSIGMPAALIGRRLRMMRCAVTGDEMSSPGARAPMMLSRTNSPGLMSTRSSQMPVQ